jgi:asparagine synthetase B (glutamine-hydrolysing)
MSKLVKLIKAQVKHSPNPAVFISGGLDSTILLHHLTELTAEEIHTYTVGLPEDNEFKEARHVAKHYGTKHTEITAGNIAAEFAKVIPRLDRPRFNLWPLYAYIATKQDGCENVYIAEGLDEHFGGYENKPPMSPQESWGGVLEWSVPTHRQLAKIYGVSVHTPFIGLPLDETIKWWRNPHVHGAKHYLKRAYRGVIPAFVIDRPKVGGRFNWEHPETWKREFGFLGEPPKSHGEANAAVNHWVTRVWLEGQR